MKKTGKRSSKQNSSKKKQEVSTDLEEHLIYSYKYGEEKKLPGWLAVVTLIVVITIGVCYKISTDLKKDVEISQPVVKEVDTKQE